MSRITARKLVAAPAGPVVTLNQMQLHLRLDLDGSPPTHPEDDLVELYTSAAQNGIEAPAGWIDRAFMPQTWRITYSGFPCVTEDNPDGALRLPFPPLIEVLSVTYRDSSGTTRTLATDQYEVSTDSDPFGQVRPLYLGIWPVTADVSNAVQVTFRCGYDEDASPPNPVPDAIKHYIMVRAATGYEQREDVGINVNLQPLENFKAAIQGYRVYGP